MAAIDFDDPTIPVDCADAVLPTGLERATCYVPELNFGSIREIYFASAPFADGVSPVPTVVEIAAQKTASKLIGPIVAQVSYTPPTDNVIRVDGQDYPRPTDLVANIVISNTTDAAVEFARTTQKGGLPGYLYGVDGNGNWFGGRNGMLGGQTILTLRNNIPTGDDDVQTITGTAKRRGYFDSIRGASPVAALQSN